MTNMKIRKGRIVKYLLLVLFLLNNFISCSMENYNINDYDNIDDEQTVNILKEYFTEDERNFILSHLNGVSSSRRIMLGETKYYVINDYEKYTCDITFYEEQIEKCSRDMNLPLNFVRGLTVIHELCHVLCPNHSHDDVWLNYFESKLKEYCQGCIDTDLAGYYGDETKFKSEDDLIEYIVYYKTNSYKRLKEARELSQSLKKSKMMEAK